MSSLRLTSPVILVYPDRCNWFYAEIARRIQSAQPTWHVCPVSQYAALLVEPHAATIIVLNWSECVYGLLQQDTTQFARWLGRFRQRLVMQGEAWGSPWFEGGLKHSTSLGVTWHGFIDMGGLPQPDGQTWVESHYRVPYRFCLDSLTQNEFDTAHRLIDQLQTQQPEQCAMARPVPWAFVGSASPQRVAFAHELQRQLPPTGLVMLPPLAPVNASSKGLQQQGLETVLKQTRFYLWTTQHSNTHYLETGRIIMALSFGAVPVRIGPYSPQLAGHPVCFETLAGFTQAMQQPHAYPHMYRRCVQHVTSQGLLGDNLMQAVTLP
jgi:hypothetical protein